MEEVGMKCPRCGAENPDSNRFCGSCGRSTIEDSRILEIPTDGRYGSADPMYPDKIEEPYVVWKWPYAIWGTSIQTHSQYVVQSILVWIFFFIIMLIPVLRFGFPALVVVLVVTAFLGILQYVFWKAGREAAKELDQARRKCIEPPVNRF